MKEKKNTKKEEQKQDYYVPVMICQILLSVLLTVLLFLFVGSNDKLKNQVSDIMNSEVHYEDVSAAVSGYMEKADSWAVFGDSVSYGNDTTDENITEAEPASKNQGTADASEAVGGVDLKTYEAKENTSFAPYLVTAKILNPIENGRYTSYFGYRINPITGDFSFHTGLDIAATSGNPIRAAWNGTVSKVGEDSQAGKYIFLEHDDGFVTFYCHCSEIVAEKGSVIRQGETIARVGSTGWSTGPHLHFEIRKDNIRLNPLWALENDC